MKIKFFASAVVIVSLLMFASCGEEKGKEEKRQTESTEKADSDCRKALDFVLKDTKGKEVRLSDFEGKVVVIDFWTTWCKYCVKEIPDLNNMYEEYRSEGLEIIGISLDQKGAAVVAPFLSKVTMNYTVLYGDQKVQNAFGGIRSLPTKFIIDRDGCIKERIVGYQSKNVILNKVLKYL